jgi:hypothetical protein
MPRLFLFIRCLGHDDEDGERGREVAFGGGSALFVNGWELIPRQRHWQHASTPPTDMNDYYYYHCYQLIIIIIAMIIIDS